MDVAFFLDTEILFQLIRPDPVCVGVGMIYLGWIVSVLLGLSALFLGWMGSNLFSR